MLFVYGAVKRQLGQIFKRLLPEKYVVGKGVKKLSA